MASVITKVDKKFKRTSETGTAIFVSPCSRLPKQESPYFVMDGGTPLNWHCVSSYDHVIPSLPGCYAIYKYNLETSEKELVYIGTAINLKNRLNKHEIKKCLNALLSYPWCTYIKCRVMFNNDYRRRIEIKFIKRLNPKGNYV